MKRKLSLKLTSLFLTVLLLIGSVPMAVLADDLTVSDGSSDAAFVVEESEQEEDGTDPAYDDAEDETPAEDGWSGAGAVEDETPGEDGWYGEETVQEAAPESGEEAAGADGEGGSFVEDMEEEAGPGQEDQPSQENQPAQEDQPAQENQPAQEDQPEKEDLPAYDISEDIAAGSAGAVQDVQEPLETAEETVFTDASSEGEGADPATCGHQYTYTSDDAGSHTGVCGLCGNTVTEACADHVSAYTSDGKGNHTGACDLCGSTVSGKCDGNHVDVCTVCGFACTGSKTNTVTVTAPVWMASDGEIEYVCRTCGRHVSNASVPGAPDTLAVSIYEKTGDADASLVKALTVSDLNGCIEQKQDGYLYANGSAFITATEYVDLFSLLEDEGGFTLRESDTITAAASDGFSYSSTVGSLNEHGYYYDGTNASEVPAILALTWGDSAAEAYYSGNIRLLLGTTSTGGDAQGRRLVGNVVSVTVQHEKAAIPQSDLALTVDPEKIASGETATVTLSNNGEALPGLTAWEARVYYDPAKFSYSKADLGSITVTDGKSDSNGSYLQLDVISADGSGAVSSGVLGTIEFTAAAVAQEESAVFGVAQTYYSDTAGNTVDSRNDPQIKTVSAAVLPKQDLGSASVTVPDQTYTGAALTPAPTVTLNGTVLAEDTDYTVAYRDNIDAGTATATITGRGAYAGTVEKTFKIAAAKLTASGVTLDATSYTYTGSAKKPAVTVKSGSKTLGSGTDYTVSYKNNVNAGTATATVTGKGNYAGTVNKTFKINAVKLTASGVTLGTTSYTYTGSARKPAVTVKSGSKTLKSGTDYTVAYKNNVNAGTATAAVTGKGNYTGSVSRTFTIKAQKITPAVTLSASSYVYSGSVRKPSVTVKKSGTKLAASNYTVTYAAGRKNVGRYSVKVTMKGNYSGTKTAYFTIRPKAAALSSVTAGSGQFTAKWTKQTVQTTGYQIQYSTSSTFASGNKTVTIAKNTAAARKVTGLNSKKKYYVRIRTYKTVDGTKYYSAWSAKKAVTTK